jgi:hypothetical protein
MPTLDHFAALFSFGFRLMGMNRRVNFNDTLGDDQGTHHTPPNVTNDITTLMESLNNDNVSRFQKDKVSGEDIGGVVKDVILVGLRSLTESETTAFQGTGYDGHGSRAALGSRNVILRF